MAQSHGYDATLVFGLETSEGTPATSYKWLSPIEEMEVEESENYESQPALGFRNPFGIRGGNKEIDMSATLTLQNGRVFLLALGKVETSGDESTGYTHMIKPVGVAETLPSFSAQIHDPTHNLTTTYTGGKVDTLSLSLTPGEKVEAELEAQFVNVDTQQSPSSVVAEDVPYFMSHEATVSINDVTEKDVVELEVEFSNSLDRKFTLNNSRNPERILEGITEVTAELTFNFTNPGTLTALRNGTPINLKVELNRLDGEKIVVELLDGVYDSSSIPINPEEGREIELEAIFKNIQVTVNTNQATLF